MLRRTDLCGRRSFNEPDLPEQANLSPALAAQLWKDHVEPLAGSAKLVSPAVTNGLKLDNGTSMGVPWLKEFLDACAGCTVDAVAVRSPSSVFVARSA